MTRGERSGLPFRVEAASQRSKRLIPRLLESPFSDLTGRKINDERPERPPQMLCICATCGGARGRSTLAPSGSWFRSFVVRCLSIADAHLQHNYQHAERAAQQDKELHHACIEA